MMLFAAFLGGARAQVNIGDVESATNDTYLPMNSLYEYSYTQQIYTAEEIGIAGTINAITLWMYGAADLYEIPFDIYMVETDKASFASNSDWVTVTSGDIVYSGSITAHNTEVEAYTFTLTTPFAYSGAGNLMIAFDNNCGQWKGGLNGMVFSNEGDESYRSLYARRDSNDYDPTNMSGISATGQTVKRNVIEIDITPSGGPSCERPASLVVSNITGFGATCTWESNVGNYTFEYKKAADSDWTVVTGLTTNTYTLSNLESMTTYNTRVKAVCSADLESGYKTANFTTLEVCPEGLVCIGQGTATNSYLPTHNYYNYSLTEQIYTAEEIGQAGAIMSIDIFSVGSVTRTLEFYMVSTEKIAFDSVTDWIVATASDLVYSGSVTFAANSWNTISFDNPFIHDGRSNVALIVRDMTGSYVSAINFYVFDAPNQAIRAYRDGSPYDLANPGSGAVLNVKNRLRLNIGEPPACPKPTGLAVNYEGGTTATVTWDGNATSYQLDVNGTTYTSNTNSYNLTGLELATTYEVKVRANCGSDGYSEWTNPVSFTTDACMPEDMISVNYTLNDSYGDGWNGNYILVIDESCTIVEQLTITSDYTATGTLRICGSYVQFLWYAGNYPGETSWVFTDNAGNVLFEGAGTANMATLDVLYTIDNNPYSAPVDVAASEVGPRSAKLSWTETGTATAWQIKLTEGDDEEGTIINANSNPFVLTGLTPETDYFAQVRAIGTNGNSIWTCVGADFTTTEACPAPQNIVVSDVTANSALVSWLGFGESYDLRYVAMPSSKGMRSSINKKPTKIDFNCKTIFGNVRFASSNNKPAMVSGVTGIQHNRNGWYYYDNGVNEGGSIGTNGGNFYWGIMIPAGSYIETSLTKTSVYDLMAMTGNVTIYNDGTDAPAGEALAQADVTLTGAGAFVETEFSEPVTIDPSKNLWIVYYNGSGATYPAAYCTAQGDANGRWVSTDGSEWFDVAEAVTDCGNFMVRAYLEGEIALDWIEVSGITASEYQLSGLDPETTYIVQIRSNCGDDGQTDYVGTNFTTISLCDNPYDLDAVEVNATSATLNWTGAQESYILRYRHVEEADPTAPATVILTAGDIWQDGSGYQMLLDADATAYGTIIPETGGLTTSGDASEETYAEFEYKIPVNADGAMTTENIVINNSISIQIPAGTYDWCITNPTPGDRIWIAAANGIGGRYDDFVFEPGVTYEFTIAMYGSNDGVDLTTTRPMSDWTEVTVNEVPYTLTGLTAETYYEWQIQGVNASCGTLDWSEIQSFTTTEQLGQTLVLGSGWNWCSANVNFTLNDLKAALVDALPGATSIQIKTKDYYTKYNGRNWRGSAGFNSLDLTQMFKIELASGMSCEFTLAGDPIDPSTIVINISNGSNWITYPLDVTMQIADAFAGFAVRNDQVKSKDGYTTKIGTGNAWRGTISTLDPGQGYIYKSVDTATKPFTFTAPSKSAPKNANNK